MALCTNYLIPVKRKKKKNPWRLFPEEKPEAILDIWVTMENGSVIRAYYSKRRDIFITHSDITGKDIPFLGGIIAWKYVEKPRPYKPKK